MDGFALDLFVLVTAQPGGLEGVEGLSRSFERNVLATLCSLLMFAVLGLFVTKERQREKLHTDFQTLQKGFQDKLLQLVEKQTEVITKQAVLTEKMEALMTRVVARLESPTRRED